MTLAGAGSRSSWSYSILITAEASHRDRRVASRSIGRRKLKTGASQSKFGRLHHNTGTQPELETWKWNLRAVGDASTCFGDHKWAGVVPSRAKGAGLKHERRIRERTSIKGDWNPRTQVYHWETDSEDGGINQTTTRKLDKRLSREERLTLQEKVQLAWREYKQIKFNLSIQISQEDNVATK